MIRYLAALAATVLIVGCDTETTLVGTWNGEMPEGQAVKTAKGDFRPNLVLELKSDYHFHASMLNATMDGTWEQSANSVVLHSDKTSINGQDYKVVREKAKAFEGMMSPAQRAELEAYDPSKPWTLEVRNGGKALYLPSRAKGISAFTFRKAS